MVLFNVIRRPLILILTVLALAAASASACDYNKCLSLIYGQRWGDTVTISFEKHGYSFAASQGDIAVIRAFADVNSVFSPRLELKDPQGHTLATAGIPGTGRTEIISPPLMTGGYVIVIYDINGSGTGRYDINIQCANHPANARTIAYGQAFADTITDTGQMKYYTFDSRTSDIVTIRMMAVQNSITPRLELYTPAGYRMSDITGMSQAVMNNLIMPASGYYLLIAGDSRGDDLGEFGMYLELISSDAESDHSGELPAFDLLQNYPNPFNPSTTIQFTLPKEAVVNLDIYDILGRKVKTLIAGSLPAGDHLAVWDGTENSGAQASSGIYFYQLRAGTLTQTRKMALLK
jgi:hypothetical protein